MTVSKWLAAAGLAISLTGVAACGSGSDEATDSSTSTQSDQADSTAGADGDSATSTEGAAAAPEPDLSGVPDPVAVVNDEEVTKAEFTTYYEGQFQQQAAQAQMSGQEVDQDQLKSDTLDLVVDSLLLTQAADEGGHEASDKDVDALLEELAKSSQMGSADEFVTAMGEQQGMDEAEVRDEAAKQVKIEKFVKAEADVEEPTEQEVRDYYDEIKAQQEQSAPGSDDAASTAGPEQPALPDYAEVKDQIADSLLQEKQSKATDALLEKLRKDADIENNL